MKILTIKVTAIAILLFSFIGNAQEKTATVNSKGVGLKREDALRDALRGAVEQVAGTTLFSETKVENFAVIRDAISTNTNGYITTYDVVKEVPFADRYEIDVKATVSTDPLKADFKTLSKAMGGVRFLVAYNPADVGTQKDNYEYSIERFNEYLSGKGYRYLDKSRFDQLKNEAFKIYAGNSDDASYVQKLGMMSDAQFIILIKKIHFGTKTEAFGTRQSQKITIEAKAYDNCTAEGLGTIVMESNWNSGTNGGAAREGISNVINNDAKRLLSVFTSYIGDWVNNGAPYELRFYSTGTYRELKDLREKLKSDSKFGGDFEIVSTTDYTKINCTFREKPEDLTDKVLEFADQIPALKPKNLDVKLLYGRQISFAPQGIKLPSEIAKPITTGSIETTKPQIQEETRPVTKVTSQELEQSQNVETQFSLNQGGNCSVKVFSESGEDFFVIVDGKKINNTPTSSVEVIKMNNGVKKMKIIFADEKIQNIDKKLWFQQEDDHLSYELRLHEKKTRKLGTGQKVYDIYTVDWGNTGSTPTTVRNDDFNNSNNSNNTNNNNSNSNGNTIINIGGPSGISIGNSGIRFGGNKNSSSANNNTNSNNANSNNGCGNPINFNQFNTIQQTVKGSMLHEQKDIATNLIRNKCLATNQIKQLANIMMLHDKLEFLKTAYSSCSDRDNYSSLSSILMLHEKNDFISFISNN